MRKRYSNEFKLEAVRLWLSSEKAAWEIEDELGLTRGRLYEWKYRLRVTEKSSVAEQAGDPPKEAEVRRLVRQERDILKKAVAIFTQPSK